MATVKIQASMHDHDLEGFLQLLRTWDNKQDDRHLAIVIKDTRFDAEETAAIIRRLSPLLDDVMVLRNK